MRRGLSATEALSRLPGKFVLRYGNREENPIDDCLPGCWQILPARRGIKNVPGDHEIRFALSALAFEQVERIGFGVLAGVDYIIAQIGLKCGFVEEGEFVPVKNTSKTQPIRE